MPMFVAGVILIAIAAAILLGSGTALVMVATDWCASLIESIGTVPVALLAMVGIAVTVVLVFIGYFFIEATDHW